MYIRGRWWHYEGVEPFAYGSATTYRIAARWLRGLAVEDWGCGAGYARRFLDGPYTGIDGAPGPHTRIVADLATYASQSPGVLMRHVLEHNDDWRAILGHAAASFRVRMALVLFTPLADTTHVHRRYDDGVPDLCFRPDDLVAVIEAAGATVRSRRTLRTRSQYGQETVLLLERADAQPACRNVCTSIR